MNQEKEMIEESIENKEVSADPEGTSTTDCFSTEPEVTDSSKSAVIERKNIRSNASSSHISRAKIYRDAISALVSTLVLFLDIKGLKSVFDAARSAALPLFSDATKEVGKDD